ncbi:DUF6879 family protein [Streptomyces sp. NBC_00829]|uniref:DUF6879 family protein n=1 Tax=Streptomyces sp. NBC_00829 TaxID=2903679 RepID=UPI0038657D5D
MRKLVGRPLTDYSRYLFEWAIPGNVEAGEDYRIVDATDREVGVPIQDFWMFDETAVVHLNYRPDGTPEVAAETGVPLGPGKRSSAMVVRGALVRRADGSRSW